jgi:hypothetical protein
MGKRADAQPARQRTPRSGGPVQPAGLHIRREYLLAIGRRR